ncbi:acyl-CoA dehydrogenase family protein [Robbsia sp. Bb-Pol-6]|uniref:Acyl-CoA dehydrogenase family protein n=1 Tax=Robbsia betulipollinis TaxID=2981849 RepID=A0ABT3ZK43_9BURK|nr:acyl-CoA dehydrogenase family protein [Robbsia betulipollinis]MCY0386717.1 acyl-CoA dehydrogenase family protein [Robbsia betulipollinis]
MALFDFNPATASDAASAAPSGESALLARFAPVFDRIAAGAVEREHNRTLAYDAVEWLREAGYTKLRIPKRYGGDGIGLAAFFSLVTRLGEADSNLPQILRVHAGFIEALLEDSDETARERWFREIVDGAIIAGAVSERTGTTNNSVRLSRRAEGPDWQLDGEKFYTTGSLYADWIDVSANDGEGDVRVLVRADTPGLQRIDDWDGFGQRLTSSGTVRFDAVRVPYDQVYRRFDASRPRRHTLQTAFFQQIHLANLAGITRAILRDAVGFTTPRTRTFGVAGASRPAENPLVQRVVGRIASLAFSVQNTSEAVSRALDAVSVARAAGRTDDGTYIHLEIQVFQAQQIILEQTLQAATLLFEVGGATATSETRRLDRYWRNARVLASHNPATLREAAIGAFYLNGRGQQETFGLGRLER